jgi:hypothetical protein
MGIMYWTSLQPALGLTGMRVYVHGFHLHFKCNCHQSGPTKRGQARRGSSGIATSMVADNGVRRAVFSLGLNSNAGDFCTVLGTQNRHFLLPPAVCYITLLAITANRRCSNTYET